MRDFLRFETMITPVLIQIIFWAAVLACIVIGIVMMIAADETSARLGGLILLIFGPIAARIYAEFIMIWFRMYDHLRRIDHNTRRP